MKLEDQAHFLGISMITCFYMRHKLYHAATEIINNQILSSEIEVDAQYLSINLKGTKTQNMPRYSKKRGGQSTYRGISHYKISVIYAVDEDDRMIMNIIGLGSESFEKYKSNEKYFGDVKELISDSKSCIQQFANHLGTTNNKVPTTPIVKKYLTKDGKSLRVINEMMTEVAGLITKTKGISTRYLQGYQNFNILRKQMKYKYKKDRVLEKIMDLLVETSSFKNIFVRYTPMPISLKEVYYEYCYGIFQDYVLLAIIFLKERNYLLLSKGYESLDVLTGNWLLLTGHMKQDPQILRISDQKKINLSIRELSWISFYVEL